MSFGEAKKGKASASDEWTTPDKLLTPIVEEYGPIVLDAAATAENAVAPAFITREEDALSCDWNARAREAGGAGIIFDNPPWSKPNKPLFLAKALETARAPGGRTVANVVPANTRDRWFHALVLSRVAGGRVVQAKLGGLWPALLLQGQDTDLWLLEGSVAFGSPLNPNDNGTPTGIGVIVFRPSLGGRPI